MGARVLTCLFLTDSGSLTADRYIVDDELFYQATIASARANNQLVAVARRGRRRPRRGHGCGRPPGNVARFLVFISESVTRAADQARAVLRSGRSSDQGSGS